LKNNFVHRGEKVFETLKENNVNLTKLAKRVYVSKVTLYERLKNENLNWEFIQEIADATKIDFRAIFPDMPVPGNMVREEAAKYANRELDDLRDKCQDLSDKLLEMQQKYINLLERYNDEIGYKKKATTTKSTA
jgi:transcriptional regulator with XRE-family HTH domain